MASVVPIEMAHCTIHHCEYFPERGCTLCRDDSNLCEHANECPSVCPCPPDCYCKTHTCKPRQAPSELEKVRMELKGCNEIKRWLTKDRDFHKNHVEELKGYLSVANGKIIVIEGERDLSKRRCLRPERREHSLQDSLTLVATDVEALRRHNKLLEHDRNHYRASREAADIQLDELGIKLGIERRRVKELEAILENLPPKPTIPPPKIEVKYSTSKIYPTVWITIDGQQSGECINQEDMTPRQMDRLISKAKELYYIVESHKLSDQGMVL